MAEASKKSILLKSQVQTAKLTAEANEIREGAKLKFEQEIELERLNYQEKMQKLNLDKQEKLSKIESGKMKAMMDVMDPKTLKSMAEAGPKYQAELLAGLGLSGFIMTDGNNPINLFNTASGLVGGQGQ